MTLILWNIVIKSSPVELAKIPGGFSNWKIVIAIRILRTLKMHVNKLEAGNVTLKKITDAALDEVRSSSDVADCSGNLSC